MVACADGRRATTKGLCTSSTTAGTCAIRRFAASCARSAITLSRCATAPRLATASWSTESRPAIRNTSRCRITRYSEARVSLLKIEMKTHRVSRSAYERSRKAAQRSAPDAFFGDSPNLLRSGLRRLGEPTFPGRQRNLERIDSADLQGDG